MLEDLLNQLPEYSKDIKLNVSGILNSHALLTEEQFWGSLLASALTSRNPKLIGVIKQQASQYLSDKAINGVYAAFAMMSMTNIYYRFTHITDNTEYAKMPAGLRMNIMRDPGVDKVNFELWSLAVSIINGCGMCINAHEKQLITHYKLSQEAIQLVAKIAAITHSLACILENIVS